MYINGTGDLYLNEDSYKFVKPIYEEFGKEEAYNMMSNLCKRRNHFETIRKDRIK